MAATRGPLQIPRFVCGIPERAPRARRAGGPAISKPARRARGWRDGQRDAPQTLNPPSLVGQLQEPADQPRKAAGVRLRHGA
jgi:hypothetical protein